MSNKRTEDWTVEGRTFRLQELGYAKAARLMQMKAKHEELQAVDMFGEETVRAMGLLYKELLGPAIDSGEPVGDDFYTELTIRQCGEAWDVQTRLNDSSEAKKNSTDGEPVSQAPDQQT